MKKHTLILFTLILALTASISAEKLAELPELGKPTLLTIDSDMLYVTEGATIHMYSAKDYKYLGKFGKQGQGPQEFTVQQFQEPMVYIFGDKLVINSISKVSFYTKKGKFIKEIKPDIPMPMRNMIQPVGDKYVGLSFGRKDNALTFDIGLFSKELKVEKANMVMPFNTNRFEMPFPALLIYSVDNKIIAGTNEGFSFNMYDKNLKKTGQITLKEYKKQKMNQTYINRIYEAFKGMMPESQYNAFKKMMKFKEFFPPYQFFYIDSGKLYALTYLTEDDKSEFYVFDIKSGKMIKRVMLPFQFAGIIPAASAIKNNKLYQIIENEDEETWELHATKIL